MMELLAAEKSVEEPDDGALSGSSNDFEIVATVFEPWSVRICFLLLRAGNTVTVTARDKPFIPFFSCLNRLTLRREVTPFLVATNHFTQVAG